jgi:alpha-mannosidase
MQERVEFHFDCDGEGMIWTTGGLPLQGLTGGFGGDRRVEYILPREWLEEADSPHVLSTVYC